MSTSDGAAAAADPRRCAARRRTGSTAAGWPVRTGRARRRRGRTPASPWAARGPSRGSAAPGSRRTTAARRARRRPRACRRRRPTPSTTLVVSARGSSVRAIWSKASSCPKKLAGRATSGPTMTRATTPPRTAQPGTRARPGAGGGVGASAVGLGAAGQFHPTSSIMATASSSSRSDLVHGDRVDLRRPAQSATTGAAAARRGWRRTRCGRRSPPAPRGDVRYSMQCDGLVGAVGAADDAGARHVGVGAGARPGRATPARPGSRGPLRGPGPGSSG